MRLRKLIRCDSIAIYVCRDGRLMPELVSGEDFRALSSLNIPIGAGLCGWVAENRKPVVNGNPQVELGYVSEPGQHTVLRSAIAVPLEGLNGVAGVLAMYRTERDRFNSDHLPLLFPITPHLPLSINTPLK